MRAHAAGGGEPAGRNTENGSIFWARSALARAAPASMLPGGGGTTVGPTCNGVRRRRRTGWPGEHPGSCDRSSDTFVSIVAAASNSSTFNACTTRPTSLAATPADINGRTASASELRSSLIGPGPVHGRPHRFVSAQRHPIIGRRPPTASCTDHRLAAAQTRRTRADRSPPGAPRRRSRRAFWEPCVSCPLPGRRKSVPQAPDLRGRSERPEGSDYTYIRIGATAPHRADAGDQPADAGPDRRLGD